MPKRSRKKLSADPKGLASGQSTRQKNPHAVALARLGARKGGLARAKKLTAERRTEIAKKAALRRWSKK
jgi:hypothetical protein